ncbi:MAG: TonB family protein [Pyrinomonadaceae bacterium]
MKPDFAEAHTGLAYSLYRSRKMKEAVAQAEVALSLNSGQEVAHYIIAAVRFDEKPNDKDLDIWKGQLETMRAYATQTFFNEQVYSTTDVTTRVIVKRKPEPQYTEPARSNGVTGTVVLRAIFASDGTIRALQILKALPDGLTQSAIASARKIKFVPATKDGRSVSVFVQLGIQLQFVLMQRSVLE